MDLYSSIGLTIMVYVAALTSFVHCLKFPVGNQGFGLLSQLSPKYVLTMLDLHLYWHQSPQGSGYGVYM